jgi:hypothetical protein
MTATGRSCDRLAMSDWSALKCPSPVHLTACRPQLRLHDKYSNSVVPTHATHATHVHMHTLLLVDCVSDLARA